MTNRRYLDPAALLSSVADIKQVLQSLAETFEFSRQYRVTVDSDYTTSGRAGKEIVRCNNTSSITVTIHSNPKDTQEVIIKRDNTGAVDVVYNSATNAVTSGGSLSLIYCDDDDKQWFKI